MAMNWMGGARRRTHRSTRSYTAQLKAGFERIRREREVERSEAALRARAGRRQHQGRPTTTDTGRSRRALEGRLQRRGQGLASDRPIVPVSTPLRQKRPPVEEQAAVSSGEKLKRRRRHEVEVRDPRPRAAVRATSCHGADSRLQLQDGPRRSSRDEEAAFSASLQAQWRRLAGGPPCSKAPPPSRIDARAPQHQALVADSKRRREEEKTMRGRSEGMRQSSCRSAGVKRSLLGKRLQLMSRAAPNLSRRELKEVEPHTPSPKRRGAWSSLEALLQVPGVVALRDDAGRVAGKSGRVDTKNSVAQDGTSSSAVAEVASRKRKVADERDGDTSRRWPKCSSGDFFAESRVAHRAGRQNPEGSVHHSSTSTTTTFPAARKECSTNAVQDTGMEDANDTCLLSRHADCRVPPWEKDAASRSTSVEAASTVVDGDGSRPAESCEAAGSNAANTNRGAGVACSSASASPEASDAKSNLSQPAEAAGGELRPPPAGDASSSSPGPRLPRPMLSRSARKAACKAFLFGQQGAADSAPDAQSAS
eukprot:TRINITY_DN44319_c0_g1_i1.p1 TRINITY_DN44319_c0_g1~~TRINITY_DN44319_c0_g1_i1.p1  ORF type:complete len:536 (+),score=90.31 TRINITY_DN44319_c0_g1_i1:97-1704(+)